MSVVSVLRPLTATVPLFRHVATDPAFVRNYGTGQEFENGDHITYGAQLGNGILSNIAPSNQITIVSFEAKKEQDAFITIANYSGALKAGATASYYNFGFRIQELNDVIWVTPGYYNNRNEPNTVGAEIISDIHTNAVPVYCGRLDDRYTFSCVVCINNPNRKELKIWCVSNLEGTSTTFDTDNSPAINSAASVTSPLDDTDNLYRNFRFRPVNIKSGSPSLKILRFGGFGKLETLTRTNADVVKAKGDTSLTLVPPSSGASRLLVFNGNVNVPDDTQQAAIYQAWENTQAHIIYYFDPVRSTAEQGEYTATAGSGTHTTVPFDTQFKIFYPTPKYRCIITKVIVNGYTATRDKSISGFFGVDEGNSVIATEKGDPNSNLIEFDFEKAGKVIESKPWELMAFSVVILDTGVQFNFLKGGHISYPADLKGTFIPTGTPITIYTKEIRSFYDTNEGIIGDSRL